MFDLTTHFTYFYLIPVSFLTINLYQFFLDRIYTLLLPREGNRTQTNNQSSEMNLSNRRQAGTTKHNILLHDMQRGKQTPGQEMRERPLQTSLNSLQKEFVELREILNAVLRDDVEREHQRRWDWMKVLERSQEWERRAGKLVYFQHT